MYKVSPLVSKIFFSDKIKFGFIFGMYMNGKNFLYVYFHILPLFVKCLIHISVNVIPNLTVQNTSEREQGICVDVLEQ